MPTIGQTTTTGWKDVEAQPDNPPGWGSTQVFNTSMRETFGQAQHGISSFINGQPHNGYRTTADAKDMVKTACKYMNAGLKKLEGVHKLYGQVEVEDGGETRLENAIKPHQMKTWQDTAKIMLAELQTIWKDCVGEPFPKQWLPKPGMNSVK